MKNKDNETCPYCEGTCDEDGWYSVTNIPYVLKCDCKDNSKSITT